MLDFVEKQRQQDRQRKGHGQAVHAQDHRVAHQTPRKGIVQKLLKPSQSHPSGCFAEERLSNFVVLKRNRESKHRPIAEDDEVSEGNDQHDVKGEVVPELMFPVISV